MRALAQYRDDLLCPSCGWPKSVCQDPMTEFTARVPPPTRCHVTTAVNRAQKAYSEAPGANPDGLLWRVQVGDVQAAQ